MVAEKAMEGRTRPARILIVDDEEFIRSAFQLYFETLGYQVLTADGGESALRAFREHSRTLDVVLLDLVMPGIHGIEVLRRMKELEPVVEVIIATGCGNMNNAIQALRYGAYDYITKPIVDFESDLLCVVQDAVAARRARSKPGSTRGGSQRGDRAAGEGQDLLESIESLVRKSRDGAPIEDRVRSIGKFVSDRFSAIAAIVLERIDESRLGRLAGWGDFESSPGGPTGRQAVVQATAIAATLSEDGSWQPVDPEVCAVVGLPSRSAAGNLEALLLPLDFGEFRERHRHVRMLILRPVGSGRPASLAAPRLLSLVVSTALAGAEPIDIADDTAGLWSSAPDASGARSPRRTPAPESQSEAVPGCEHPGNPLGASTVPGRSNGPPRPARMLTAEDAEMGRG